MGKHAVSPDRNAATCMPDRRPNLLLITTDQQSHDAMGFLRGPERPLHTPAMDQLAAKGCVFTRAYCAHPLCVPSRTAMVTGRYPHETGVVMNKGSEANPHLLRSLALHFREAGYATAYFGKWHSPIPLQDAETSGFEVAEANAHNGVDRTILAPAAAFLERTGGRPFFMTASYNNPHNICEWARGERRALPDGEIPDPPPASECPPMPSGWEPDPTEPDILTALRRGYHAAKAFPVHAYTEADWRIYRWAYDRMVEHVDAHIGRLLDALERSGQADNTLIVFLSDHGDAQGWHRWNQKTIFHDSVTRVPFIMVHPASIRPGVRGDLVQTGTDLMPTLLEAAGLAVPAELPGVSHWRTATGGESVPPRRRRLVVETAFNQHAPLPELPPVVHGRMLVEDQWKFCVYSHGERRESLHNLADDPHESRNLAPEGASRQTLEHCRDVLRNWMRKHEDPIPPAAFGSPPR
ncbi:MAG: hypothetical protein EA425_00815 [Puniceicoccaceae bacterium]|nr:MAG: hypothetical protein EA425_00815 [Puniceicoccaceae bacterium]